MNRARNQRYGFVQFLSVLLFCGPVVLLLVVGSLPVPLPVRLERTVLFETISKMGRWVVMWSPLGIVVGFLITLSTERCRYKWRMWTLVGCATIAFFYFVAQFTDL